MKPLQDLARSVRDAQRMFAGCNANKRSQALLTLADTLQRRKGEIIAANATDIEAAHRDGLDAPLLSRLQLSESKIEVLCDGLRTLADRPDPVGQIQKKTRLDDGLMLTRVASPIGVLLIIFESRPDAVIQIGALALRSGNAVIMKGGREAARTNAILVACIQESLATNGLPERVVVGVEGRERVAALLEMDGYIDLVIPRGSGSMVRHIQESTRIPVLGHADGICSLYLDKAADPHMAVKLAVDGKCDYPSACNATETLLVHAEFLPHLKLVGDALTAAGVQLRADDSSRPYLSESEPASELDGKIEYGDLTLAIRVVKDRQEAIDFIHAHGSGHTDAIVTENPSAAAHFLRIVDSASVFHNASTRFADGFRYGLGAEVGISTGRIHARGPVGVEGLMTTRWLLEGSGQGAGDYGPGKRAFQHVDEAFDA